MQRCQCPLQGPVIRTLTPPKPSGSTGVPSKGGAAALARRGSHQLIFSSPSPGWLMSILQHISKRGCGGGAKCGFLSPRRLHNYIGRRRAIQFFTRFSSAEVIPLCCALHARLSPPCCWTESVYSNPDTVTPSPSSSSSLAAAVTDSCRGSAITTNTWPLKRSN